MYDKAFFFLYPIVWAHTALRFPIKLLATSQMNLCRRLNILWWRIFGKISEKEMATISLHNFWSPLLGILNSLCKKCCVACRFWRAREECLPCSELGPINGWPKVRQTHDLVVVSCSPPATSPGVMDKLYNWVECHKSLVWKGKHTSTNIHFNQTLEVTKLGTQYLSAQECGDFSILLPKQSMP